MKANLTVLALNGGEADKQTLARADLDIYSRLAETMENCFPYTNGGMSKVPGSKFLDDVTALAQITDEGGTVILDENGTSEIVTEGESLGILRPFVRSREISYALELSANQMRFVDNATATYVTITGANATIGAFTDQSAAPSSGGAAPITGGTSDVSDPFYLDIDYASILTSEGGYIP
jgi:hypothetical protein